MAYKPTVVFDFDGVISTYKSGWIGETVIPDPVVPGIKELFEKLRKNNYRVVVVSTRCRSDAGMEAVKQYLSDNDIVVDEVSAYKPPAVCYIDDRAICFDGNTDGLFEKILYFKSWTEYTYWYVDKKTKTATCSKCDCTEAFNEDLVYLERCPNCGNRIWGFKNAN